MYQNKKNKRDLRTVKTHSADEEEHLQHQGVAGVRYCRCAEHDKYVESYIYQTNTTNETQVLQSAEHS